MDRDSRLVRAGFVLSGLTLLLPFLWPVAVLLAVLVLRGEHQKQGGMILFLGGVLLPAIGGAVWLTFVVTAYRVPSETMEPNVDMGTRFVVLKLGYEPRVGDIAVFEAPAASQEARQCRDEPERGQMCSVPDSETAGVKFVKRIVAGPGDRVAMRDGRLIRNGRAESGYPLGDCEEARSCTYPNEIEVPDGHFFVLGDNRGFSDDSRFFGPVPAANFVGRRLFTYWPG